MFLGYMRCHDVKWIQLAEERDQWWTLTEHSSEPTVYVTGGELHDLLNNYQLLTAA
jgi:hypothetical protein